MALQVHKRRKGDTLLPIAVRFERPDGRQVDIAGETIKFKLLKPDGTVKVALTDTNVTIHPTQTFTADSATDKLTAVNHKLSAGLAVLLSTTTTLPGGLATAMWYWVVNAKGNTFQLATEPGGTPIDITSAGTGTHSFTIIGSVQYAPATADVDTKGKHPAYFVRVDGTDTEHFPVVKREFIVEFTED